MTNTDTNEPVEKELLNKLALMITRAEECFAEDGERNAFVDMLDDPTVAQFLDGMRKSGRCPFRRFPVR